MALLLSFFSFFLPADRENNKVPESFPGTIMVSLEPDSEMWHVHKDYRQSEEPTPEFKYFVERILTAIQPPRNKFNDRKGKKKLSEIYTVTDEAFGLVILLNELHCWEECAERKEASDRYGRKRFCDGRSGNKKGWKNWGLIIYNRLCKNVQRRRQMKESIEMEKNMYKEYSRNNSRHGDSSSDESGADESVFQDDAILGDTEKLKNKT